MLQWIAWDTLHPWHYLKPVVYIHSILHISCARIRYITINMHINDEPLQSLYMCAESRSIHISVFFLSSSKMDFVHVKFCIVGTKNPALRRYNRAKQREAMSIICARFQMIGLYTCIHVHAIYQEKPWVRIPPWTISFHLHMLWQNHIGSSYNMYKVMHLHAYIPLQRLHGWGTSMHTVSNQLEKWSE